MNIEELKESIEDLPDDMEVILQKDQEGNGYQKLRIIDSDCIRKGSGDEWNIEVYSTHYSAEDNDMEDDEWEELKKTPRILVLSP